MPEETSLSHKRLVMYVIGFVFNLSYAIPTYISSTFLAKITSDSLVGIVYTASSILAIAAFIEMPSLMRRFGNFKVTIALLILEILSLAGLITGRDTMVIISAFMLNFVTIALINFTLDVFLEQFSNNGKTGRIRGSFLTVVSLAWLVAPLLSSVIFDGNENFRDIYLVSGLLLIPVIALLVLNLRRVQAPVQNSIPFWKSFGKVWSDRNIKGVLLIQFLLQFFYAWMVIYTPLYLYETIGFDVYTVGIIFTIMLLPFVILEGFLGRLADRIGEKIMLSVGFVIMGVSTGLVALITDNNAVVWTLVLFMTRIGAATVEVMADTYFFKKVDASNTDIISFFRTARPLAYVIGPILATLLFMVFDMRGLFVFLGLLMLYGLRYSTTIDDVA